MRLRNPDAIVELPLEEPLRVETTPPFTVTAIDANHCPGAALLLFELDDGRKYLHTGDMRASEGLVERSPTLTRCVHRLTAVLLDTTYANPKYSFEPQGRVIDEAVEAVQARLEADASEGEHTLFLFSTYSLGKERILFRILEDTRVQSLAVSPERRVTFECMSLEDRVLSRIVAANSDADLAQHAAHVVGCVKREGSGGDEKCDKVRYPCAQNGSLRFNVAVFPAGF